MQFNGVSCNLYFIEKTDIYFQTVTDEVFLAWCNWLDRDLKGTFYKSNEVEPVGKNRIARDALYTKAEKKRIKPTAECCKMYAMNNKDCYAVLDILSDKNMQRILQEVDVTGLSLYDSILYQISHDRKYKAYDFHRQIGYYMARWHDICAPIAKLGVFGKDSYESLIKNLFYGYSYPKVFVVISTITKMWNVSVDLVTPKKGLVKCFHNQPKADIVIVHNDQKDLESLYTATKGSGINWRPVKGVDWSNEIKSVSNVKVAAQFAEKKFRSRTARTIMEEYRGVSDSLKDMKTDLVKFHQEMKAMKSKIDVWSKNVNLMESRQAQLRIKLTELGVNINSFSEQSSFVPGFHELCSTADSSLGVSSPAKAPTTLPADNSLGAPSHTKAPTTLLADSSLGVLPSVNSLAAPSPAVTTSTTETLGEPPAECTGEIISTIAEIHSTSSDSTPETSTPQATPELEVLKTISGDKPRSQQESNIALLHAYGWSAKTSTNTTTTTLTLPTTFAVPTVVNTLSTTPTISTAQAGIINVGGQSFIIPTATASTSMLTPSASASVAGRSLRWGRVLKGTHKFFCHRCNQGFTQKADCTRHEDSDCPMLDPEEKKPMIVTLVELKNPQSSTSKNI